MSGSIPFEFEDTKEALSYPNSLLVEIPFAYGDIDTLVSELKRQSVLPDYCGSNFNALDECFGDLSWISHERLILFHHQLPFSGTSAAAVYISVLADPVRGWRDEGLEKLMVVFPRALFHEVKKLLRQKS